MTDIIIQENYLKKQNETTDELSSKMTNSFNIETSLEKQGQEKSFQLSFNPSVNQDKILIEKQIELPLPFHQNKEFEKKSANRDSNNQNSSILTPKPNYYQQHNQINSSRIIPPYNNNKQYHHQVYENQQPNIIRISQADQRFRIEQQNKFKIDKQQGIITPAASVSDMNEDNQKMNNQISRMPNDNLNQINPINPINDFSKFSYIPEKQQDYQRLISANNNRNQIYQNQINQPCFNRIGSRDGMLPKQYFNNYNSQLERLSIDPLQDRFSQLFLTHPDINRKEHQIPPILQHPEISLEQILIYKSHDYDNLKNQLKQKKTLYELRQKTRFQLITLIQKENNNLIEQKLRCVELVQCIQDCIDFMAGINEIQSQLYVIREEQEEIKKKIHLQQQISKQLKPQPMQDETIKVEYDANEKCDKSQTVISIENIQNNQDQNTTQDDKAVDKQIDLEINGNQLKIKENVIQGGQIHNEFQQEQILIKKEGDAIDRTMPNNQFNLNQQENQLQNKSKYSQQHEDVIQQKYLDKLIHPFNGVSHPALQVISQPSTQISRPPPYSFEVQDFPYQNYQHIQLANSNPRPLFPSKPQFNQNNGQIQTIVKEEHIPETAVALSPSKQLEDRDDENESMSEEDNNKKYNNSIYNQKKQFPQDQNQVYQAFDNQVKIEQANIDNYLEYQQMGSQYLYAQNNQVGQNNSSQPKEYNNQIEIRMRKRLDKKPKKHSDTKDLIRFRKGQEKDVKQLTYLQLSEQELQKKLQFHNQLKIFMLQSSKYIKEQILEKIKLNEVKEEQEIYEQHIRYLDAFKNRFTKSDLSYFLKIINEISYEEIIDNMKELDQKLKLIKQRKITYIITIIKSFTNEDQFKQIFPEENEEIFEQNSTYLSEHLLQNRQKIQQINEYIGKINYFNKMNRTYLQNYCLYQLSITACKKKASKLDQLYVKNYVLQMLNNPSHIE